MCDISKPAFPSIGSVDISSDQHQETLSSMQNLHYSVEHYYSPQWNDEGRYKM